MSHPTSQQGLLNPNQLWWAGISPRDDRSAAALLSTEAAAGHVQRSVYELFSEMEEKDAHLHSVLQTRINGLLGLPRRVVPSADTAPARAAAAFANDAFAQIPRAEQLLRALLDGISKGFAVVELLWDYDAAGRLIISDWIAHPQEWFAFDAEGRLLLLTPPFRGSGAPIPIHAGRATYGANAAIAPPPRKFIALRFGADFRNPYGRGLCQRAYWLYWFKKNCLKYWAVFNEKHGMPTAVATCGAGTQAEERTRLRAILDALQTDSSIVLPETVKLSLLEANRSGSSGNYREFLDWANDEISKLALGATLTSGEGRRSGSLSLGSVHQLVRQDYIEADARLLEGLLAETVLAWLVELNFPGAPAPRLRIDTASPEDLGARIAVDRDLLALGIALPQNYFYEQYGRPMPAAGDQPLRYDDANFYQYHLQFGVLTVNEVRARLGLPQVPWGGVRTASENGSLAQAGEDVGRIPK